MKKYQDSKTTNADFEVTYVGWIAEEEIKKREKIFVRSKYHLYT
jgi:hypothetical protein